MNGAFAWEQGSEQPRAGAWPELWEKAALFLALVSLAKATWIQRHTKWERGSGHFPWLVIGSETCRRMNVFWKIHHSSSNVEPEGYGCETGGSWDEEEQQLAARHCMYICVMI